MESQDYDEIRRIRQHLHDTFVQLERELEQARGLLHTHALLDEDARAFRRELAGMQGRSDERRAREERACRKHAAARPTFVDRTEQRGA
jgi:hypothetical protein